MGYKEYDDEQPLNEEQEEAYLHETMCEAGCLLQDDFMAHVIISMDDAGNLQLVGSNTRMVKYLVEEVFTDILAGKLEDGE